MINYALDRLLPKNQDEAAKWAFRGFGLAIDLGLIFALVYFFII